MQTLGWNILHANYIALTFLQGRNPNAGEVIKSHIRRLSIDTQTRYYRRVCSNACVFYPWSSDQTKQAKGERLGTLLVRAADAGEMERVAALLDSGADPDFAQP